jgi:glyoxylase-like metal-dependent hydrolase (beta-lactamase superfamily II)
MEQLAENIYVETEYDGVNVGAVVTRQGIIAIDVPSYPRQARNWAMQLHALHHSSVQFIILTDYHGDRILNTRWLHAPIIAHQATTEKLNSYDKRYPVALLDSLIMRSPDKGRELSNSPVERTTLSFSQNLYIRKENLELVLMAAPGPTLGNIWVYVPQSGILFTGDTVTIDIPPLLSEGSSQEWLNTIKRLQQWPQEINAIVPGRGRICQREAIEPIRHYWEHVQMRIRQHIDAGRTREETAVYIPELIDLFPQTSLPTEWLQAQIKRGLDRVYDEIQLAENGEASYNP